MYDLVIFTHLPSFYKINIYNELATKYKLYVIFLGSSSVQRTNDFISKDFAFDNTYLFSSNFELRNKLITSLKTIMILRKLKFKKIIVSGWDNIEYWICSFFIASNKIALCLESTILESSTKGINGFLKSRFISMVGHCLAAGSLHAKLLDSLHFKGSTYITKGVGIIHKPKKVFKSKKYQKMFLYIGRISPEKNIDFLQNVFKNLPDHKLTIIGKVDQVESFHILSDNISYLPHVANKDIGEHILHNDFLILPSISEPWGLVTEEALYFKRPVIISKNCGSIDLITTNFNGYHFSPTSKSELTKIILSINNNSFQRLVNNIPDDFLTIKDNEQVVAYENFINS